jgi:hypothetical protein
MRFHLRFLALSGALVLASATASLAGDICLNLGGFSYVGKSVSIPGKGKCGTWKGIAPSLCAESISTGSICRNSADNRVNVHIETSCFGGAVYVDHVTLPYPSLVGGAESFSELDVGSGGSVTVFSADRITCAPSVQPIPKEDDTPKGQFLAGR